jgi:hypothetical protein
MKCRMIWFVLCIAFLQIDTVFSGNDSLWDMFISYEDFLRQSEFIVTATVENTDTKREINGTKDYLTRITYVTILNVVKGNEKIHVGEVIPVYTKEGTFVNNAFVEPDYHTASFNPGEKILLFLREQKGEYRLFYEAYGKYRIENNTIEKCNVQIDKYIAEINNILSNKKDKFGLPYPDFYMNKKEKVKGTAKIADAYSLPCSDYQFGVWVDYESDDSPATIEFHINPTDAKDSNGNNISFATLYYYADRACDLWNAASGGGINFSVSPDSMLGVYEGYDDISIICFKDWDEDAQVIPRRTSGDLEYDIVFKNKNWPIEEDYSYKRTIAHEIGHCTGLGDMGNSCWCHDDPLTYRENLMWHSGGDMDVNIDSPQKGDIQGVIYCEPLMTSSTLPYNRILLSNINLTNGLYIGINDTVEVEEYSYNQIGANKIINLYGTLTLFAGSKLDCNDLSSRWGYTDVNTGATLNINPGVEIEFSNGILLYGSANFPESGWSMNGCIGGIWAFSGSPIIQHTAIHNNSSLGVCLASASASPSLSHVIIDGEDHNPIYGITIASAGDITIEQSIIHQTSSNCIHVYDSSADIFLENGNNDFYPVSGAKAIYNSSGKSINADWNYWGTSTPVKADLFLYPNVVTMDYYSTSAYNGSSKIAEPRNMTNPVMSALKQRISGDYVGALDSFYSIITKDENKAARRNAIKNIFQINSDHNLSFDRIRSIIQNEQKNATSWYKASLDYLWCDSFMYEGDYERARSEFEVMAKKYNGTSMEVEMLSRLAVLHADCFNDSKTALEYANAAARVNPGQAAVRGAFLSAGVEYDNTLYVNKFENVTENYENLSEPEKELTESVFEDSVTLSPNPFNPTTTITYTLANPGRVNLSVYSITGQKIAILVDSPMDAGTHSVVFDGSNLASGIYLYRFESPGFAKTGKMLMVK